MSSKRNPNVVTALILEICTGGAGKTKIIYKANLNAATGTQYLNNPTRNGYIEAIPKGTRLIYKTTPKGMELQEKLAQIKSLMDHLFSYA